MCLVKRPVWLYLEGSVQYYPLNPGLPPQDKVTVVIISPTPKIGSYLEL